MAERASSQNRWVDAYVHAFDGLEEQAGTKIAGVKFLDFLAAQKGCAGFDRYLVDSGAEEGDPLLVEGYEHTAECGERYERLFASLVTSEKRFVDEREFLGLHATVFAGCERCGRYATATGGIRRAYGANKGAHIYVAAPPEEKPLELRRAFEAYGAACAAHPDLSVAYLGLLSVHVNHIHPFHDGNGRSIRILVASELAHMGLRKSVDIPLAATGKKVVTVTLLRHGGLYGLPDTALCAEHPEVIPDYSRFSHLGEHGLLYLDMLLAAYRLLIQGATPSPRSGERA